MRRSRCGDHRCRSFISALKTLLILVVSVLGPFAANPFTDVARTVRDSAVICFEIRQKCDYVSIDELNACQIENQGLTIAFHDPFQFRQDPRPECDHSERASRDPDALTFQSESLEHHRDTSLRMRNVNANRNRLIFCGYASGRVTKNS
jgi:hypothetical protein